MYAIVVGAFAVLTGILFWSRASLGITDGKSVILRYDADKRRASRILPEVNVYRIITLCYRICDIQEQYVTTTLTITRDSTGATPEYSVCLSSIHAWDKTS